MKTLNDKQKRAEANRRYYTKHKAERSEKARLYYIEHKEEYRERAQRYYIKNKETLSQKHKKYYQEHRDKTFNKKQLKILEITKAITPIEGKHICSENNLENTRTNIENYLLEALQVISANTKYEDICRALIETAKANLRYCDNQIQ